MCPTIRIDDEVYRWLQEQAVPFDDTPNSVLRRLAKFDQKQTTVSLEPAIRRGATGRGKDYSGRRSALATGPQLIQKWKIPVRQARFHRDGTWFEQLTRFPAALCDPNGHVVFESEEDYRSCPQLKLGKQVNVTGGISSIPGYKRVKDPLA